MATDRSKRSTKGRRADDEPACTDGKTSVFATVKRTFTEFSEDVRTDEVTVSEDVRREGFDTEGDAEGRL